jgi:RHS repeat-associated protein
VAYGGVGQGFGFSGREHDLDAELVYARARYLNPALGAWTQADRLGMIDGPNVYGYVGANPVLRVDPSGNFFIIPALLSGALGGLFAGAGAYIMGQRGIQLAQSIGLGVAIGLGGAIFPAFGLSVEGSAMIAGAIVGAIGNLYGQFLEWMDGTRKDLDLWSLVLAVGTGAFAGLAGGTFAPGSKLFNYVQAAMVDTAKDLWQATMTAAVIGGLAGGAPDVFAAVVRRFALLIAVTRDTNYDYELRMCLDPRVR